MSYYSLNSPNNPLKAIPTIANPAFPARVAAETFMKTCYSNDGDSSTCLISKSNDIENSTSNDYYYYYCYDSHASLIKSAFNHPSYYDGSNSRHGGNYYYYCCSRGNYCCYSHRHSDYSMNGDCSSCCHGYCLCSSGVNAIMA